MSMLNTEKTVKDARRKTCRKFSTEEKIRIVLDGLRGECSVAELCRKEGINPNLYYRWRRLAQKESGWAGFDLGRRLMYSHFRPAVRWSPCQLLFSGVPAD